MHSTRCLYAMVIILRSSAVASPPYFVFIVSECCSSAHCSCSCSCKATFFKTVQWAHYLHSFLYVAWSRCKCTRNWEPNQYIYVLTTFFFLLFPSSISLRLALARKCCCFLVYCSYPQSHSHVSHIATSSVIFSPCIYSPCKSITWHHVLTEYFLYYPSDF